MVLVAWVGRLFWTVGRLGEQKPGDWLRPLAGMLAVLVGITPSLWSAEGSGIFRLKRSYPEGSTSREAQEAALQAIPWERLQPTARAKIEEVVSGASLFRRMPTELIQCEPEFFLFCVHHPEVVVNIWQVLGLSRMKLQPTPQGVYHVDDGMGTRCQVEFLYQSPELHLIYAQGSYEGPVLKRKVQGRAVLVLHSPVHRQEDGRTQIACGLDTFLQMEPGAVEVLTKTLHPFIGRVSDYNFKQTARFVEELWLCGERNPGQLERLVSRLHAVSPELRQEFLRLTRSESPPANATSGQTPRPLPKGIVPEGVGIQTSPTPLSALDR